MICDRISQVPLRPSSLSKGTGHGSFEHHLGQDESCSHETEYRDEKKLFVCGLVKFVTAVP